MAEEASDDIGNHHASQRRGSSDAGEVAMRSPHRKVNPADGTADGQAARPRPPHPADRSCCCPARPVVTVVIPPGPGRPRSADLLLCGHHYLASQAALAAVGASVNDVTGTVVDPAPGHRGLVSETVTRHR